MIKKAIKQKMKRVLAPIVQELLEEERKTFSEEWNRQFLSSLEKHVV